MTLAQETNRYLDDQAPWKIIKENQEAAAAALYSAIVVISALKTALYPFLPFSSQKVHEYLGFDGNVQDAGWRLQMPSAGQSLKPPQVLFTKLDESVVAEEQQRMGLTPEA